MRKMLEISNEIVAEICVDVMDDIFIVRKVSDVYELVDKASNRVKALVKVLRPNVYEFQLQDVFASNGVSRLIFSPYLIWDFTTSARQTSLVDSTIYEYFLPEGKEWGSTYGLKLNGVI